jgi:predicted dehydrogenase
VHGVLSRPRDLGDIEIVGIAEPDGALAGRYLEQHGIDAALRFPGLVEMLDAVRPEAVVVFTNTFDHLEVVEACAPRGVSLMVEKPLAVNREHAEAMAALAGEHGVHLLVNYETTWYRSTVAAGEIVKTKGEIGGLRKFVAHHGHQGPVEIGCDAEFLAWLTDPVLNGGGALTDFGCYGVNLCTWLMGNVRPTAVTAVTQQMKPEVYPEVEDEATIILAYPEAQAIVQASWNWPFNRKDIAVYGTDGYAVTVKEYGVKLNKRGAGGEALVRPKGLAPVQSDPFAYFAAVVRGEIDPAGSLSSLENNLIVTEVLDAARESAERGETVLMQRPE